MSELVWKCRFRRGRRGKNKQKEISAHTRSNGPFVHGRYRNSIAVL